MPQLIITEAAREGLDRCRIFLSKNPGAGRRAAEAIAKHFRLLTAMPHIGRPFSADAGLRELVVDFGASGYVALYRYDADADAIYVLAFRHQREAGYP